MDIIQNQKKEYIVIAAIDLIHENGMNNISTKEIAKRIGISESLIFKLYPKKNDLILAVFDRFSLYDNDMLHTAKDKYEDANEAISFYLNNFLLYYENYPAITSVLPALIIQYGILPIEARAKEIILGRINHLQQLIVRGQEKGLIKTDIDPNLVADILFNVFNGMCIKWRIMNYDFPLRERTNMAIEPILQSIRNK